MKNLDASAIQHCLNLESMVIDHFLQEKQQIQAVYRQNTLYTYFQKNANGVDVYIKLFYNEWHSIDRAPIARIFLVRKERKKGRQRHYHEQDKKKETGEMREKRNKSKENNEKSR